MAITASEITSFGTVSATVAIQRPNNVQDGDLMILALNWVQGVSISTHPNTWTFITSGASSAGPGNFNDLGTALYYKHASSEPASYSAAFSGSDRYFWEIVTLRGQLGSTTAIDSPANVLVGLSATPTMAVAAITVSSTLSYRLVFGTQLGFATGPGEFTLQAGYTQLTAFTGTAISTFIWSKQLVGSGVDAAVAAITVSDAAGISPWITISLAIRQDPAFSFTAVSIFRLMCLTGVGK